MKRDKPGKKAFWKKIKYPRPLSYFKKSPIDIRFRNPHNPESFHFWPADRGYLQSTPREAPFRLIDAINEDNELVLRIGLNFKSTEIKKEFSKVLKIALKEMERYGRSRSKISEREYDNYLRAIQLRDKDKWTFLEMAEEMFPRDFVVTAEGGKIKSAIEKARRFYHEAKRLIEGEDAN